MGGGASTPKEETTFQRMTVNRKQKNDNNQSKGKNNSKDSVQQEDPHAKPAYTTYIQTINDKSSRMRMDKGRCQQPLKISGERLHYELDWCYASQRGYYPDAHEKANQDSYVLCENFNKDSNSHFFGIFDGHGELGDLCSHFAANNLPAFLETELYESASKLDDKTKPKQLEKVLTNSFLKTNSALRRSKIDDSLSGTTAISVFIQGDTLYVSNVGDSRAIMATEVNGKITFAPLSRDQTPLRKDERERLKARGAIIRNLDQIEGVEQIHENWGEDSDSIEESADPPRVWDSTLERPGCAFSRSIGDGFAEMVGVCAEPEILSWQLSLRDRFIIICSDGVTEFLTSSMIVDMMATNKDHFVGACRIIEESYRLWLTYDSRTDDISMIVLTLNNMGINAGSKDETEVKTESNEINKLTKISSVSSDDYKPVRRVMSKAKRKEIAENWNQDDGSIANFDLSKHISEKTADQLERITSMVRSNFMFQNLSPSQRHQIFSVMKLRDVKQGELIIREGDVGDEMYVIDAGEFTVLKKNAEGVNMEVFTYKTDGAIFGELSLMYGKPRAASVKASTDGRLWSIGRMAFRKVLMPKKSDGGRLRLLKSIHFFQDLKFSQIHIICESSYEEDYNSQQSIILSKEVATCKWALAIIMSGSVQLNSKISGGKPQNRVKDSYITIEEVRNNYSAVFANEKTQMCFFPKDTVLDAIGEEAYSVLCESMIAEPSKSGGRIVKRGLSIFSPQSAPTQSQLTRSDFSVESVMLLIGDYAYVGAFSTVLHGEKSGKVLAKERAKTNRMSERFLQEKRILESIPKDNFSGLFTSLIDFYQDSKIAIFLYSDLFVSDLTEALNNGAITDQNRSFYISSVVAAVAFVHDIGFMHRFINPGSFYITSGGQLKLVDMRYAIAMDGDKHFTICGDPLYFSPELVSQQGYDYSNDIWAIGVMLLELFGVAVPWRSLENDESKLFSAISSFKVDKLVFPGTLENDAKELILGLLNPSRTGRLGYKSYSEIKDVNYFRGLQWKSIGQDWRSKIDFKLTLDISLIFNDADLNPLLEESDIFSSGSL